MVLSYVPSKNVVNTNVHPSFWPFVQLKILDPFLNEDVNAHFLCSRTFDSILSWIHVLDTCSVTCALSGTILSLVVGGIHHRIEIMF